MSISVDLARRILEACKQRAYSLHSPVSIAIVDAGGHLVLFERMMAPYGWATGNISQAKANTAVMFNQSTDAVAQWASAIPGFAASLSSMTSGNFIMAAGGWPIRVNGITIGGIGVSGGNAPGRDDDIARAGLAVLESIAPQPFPAAPQPAPQAAAPFYSNGVSAPASAASGDYAFRKQDPPPATRSLGGEENDPYNAFREESTPPSHEERPGDQV